MASLAATNWERPISLVPLLSWSTASCVFTQGVMSGAIPWQLLQEQFFKNNLYNDEISKLIVSPERAYQLGQQFVINYSRDLEQAKKSQKEQEKVLEVSNNKSSLPSSALLSPSSSSSSSTSSVLKTPVFVEGDNHSSTSTLLSQSSSTTEGLKTSSTSSLIDDNSILSPSPTTAPSIPTVSRLDSKNDGSPKVKSSREENRRLTLNYAQTKQSQQSLNKGSSQKDKTKSTKLTLDHAVAKSRILFSRKTKDKEEKGSGKEEMKRRSKNLQEESYEFMRGVMDECTHLANFSVPVDPELVIIVSAKQDAYIPRDGVLPLDKLWPGCEVRYVDQGHVGAVLLHQNVFRKAVMDAFDKQVQKYYPDLAQDLRRIRQSSQQRRRGKDS